MKIKKIIITDTFTKSLKVLMNSKKFYRLEFWREKWYNLRWAIRNLRLYFNIVTKARDWDFFYILQMMKFQLGFLKERIRRGHEVINDKCEKVRNIERVIELITNIEEDNFRERCGYNSAATKMEFIEEDPTESGEVMYRLEFVKQPGFEDYNEKAIFNCTNELQEKEWRELLELLSKARSWWE
jgi:hypothetical protein